MAGSLRLFRYTNDAGADFTFKTDESNGEATVGGVTLMRNRIAASPFPSKGFQPRYINAVNNADTNIKRKFLVGNPLAIAQINAGAAMLAVTYPGQAATAWSYNSIRGERSRLVPPLNTTGGDTGLTDGDQGIDQP
jgi:hypothetical protein